jgi:hypothetical protein
VAQNKLYGFIGIYLQWPTGSKAIMNDLYVTWQGVLLGHGVDENKILANRIIGPQMGGIAFEGENDGNVVVGNKVACAQGSECLVVAAYPQAYQTNTIKGNTYFQSNQLYVPGEASD